MKKAITKQVKELEPCENINSVIDDVFSYFGFDYTTDVDSIDIDDIAEEYGLYFESEEEKHDVLDAIINKVEDLYQEHYDDIEYEYFRNRSVIEDTLEDLAERFDIPASDIVDMISNNLRKW